MTTRRQPAWRLCAWALASQSGRRRTRWQWLAGALLVLVCLSCAVQRGTVGARFARDDEGQLFVRDAPSGLGAARAGLRPGDQVLLIDGRDVRPMDDSEIHRVLSGERGTRVRFTIVRHEEILRAAVERTPPPTSEEPQR